ncbi:rhomboid family intramembrane serine protease [Paenibacillus donghaensis]|uniref:Rhomboid family intramembrane serine protease n=1 Tax=Paenibacillus donghaensis TaxID=414771 RepID=A0A2Z2KQU5_9BACL|nr:rhomboid family intramembrane serine protease [Paenibacillus donghaensis]ASA26230.1 rhomboid family intramembrane serine protease [Paenibacillus donghaensis]
MIFIRYENWKSYLRYYPVTSLLLLANIVMFIIVSLDGGSTNLYTLVKYGAVVDVGPEKEEAWRYLASVFLHNGFNHLFFNSFSLLVFAPPLERLLGWWRYAILYLGGGILANVLFIALGTPAPNTATVSVGASGAIYAVYGAFMYIALLQRAMMDESSRKTLYGLLVIGIITSFAAAKVNWLAHLGGLAAGFFLYGLIIRIFKSSRRQGR